MWLTRFKSTVGKESQTIFLLNNFLWFSFFFKSFPIIKTKPETETSFNMDSSSSGPLHRRSLPLQHLRMSHLLKQTRSFFLLSDKKGGSWQGGSYRNKTEVTKGDCKKENEIFCWKSFLSPVISPSPPRLKKPKIKRKERKEKAPNLFFFCKWIRVTLVMAEEPEGKEDTVWTTVYF